MNKNSKQINIAIAGIGTVGTALVDLLLENIFDKTSNCKINLIAISSRSKRDIGNIKWYANALDLIKIPEIDLIIELIGGEDGIAYELCKKSLKAKKHIITANKALIAKHGNELIKIAKQNNKALLFEAAVAGGIPIIKTLKESLACDSITNVNAILNGTCNYILSEMYKTKQDFQTILKQAQDIGYAEADPTFDVDGIDAAHKIAIISSLAFNTEINFFRISITGIRNINSYDINFTEKFGYVIKLISTTTKEDNKIKQIVRPIAINQDNPLANINGSLNSVDIQSKIASQTLLIGHGAGGMQTAGAVISDIYDIIRNDYSFNVNQSNDVYEDYFSQSKLYYLRISSNDLSKISATILKQEISENILGLIIEDLNHNSLANISDYNLLEII